MCHVIVPAASYPCESVQYSSTGCIKQNGNACVCDDALAASCSALTGQSTSWSVDTP